jgi:hypothetical protein
MSAEHDEEPDWAALYPIPDSKHVVDKWVPIPAKDLLSRQWLYTLLHASAALC